MIKPITRNCSPLVNAGHVQRLLAVDHVLTDAQLARFGLDGQAFPGLRLTVRPMKDSLREETVTFRALQTESLERGLSRLPHYAATAEIRHMLGASNWEIDHQGFELAPDAVWRDDHGQVAIEYDAGYRPGVVRRKMQAFAECYRETVWATPSSLRSARIQARYPQARVLTVDYWSPPRTE